MVVKTEEITKKKESKAIELVKKDFKESFL